MSDRHYPAAGTPPYVGRPIVRGIRTEPEALARELELIRAHRPPAAKVPGHALAPGKRTGTEEAR